jgi:CHAT domain-containing protein
MAGHAVTTSHCLLIVALTMAAQSGGDAAAGLLAPQSAAAPVAVLYEGATIERAAAKRDRHRYEVSMTEGDYLEMTVSQDRHVVALSVSGPDGAVLHSVSVPDTDPLPQYLIFVAPAAGTYSIDVAVAGVRTHLEQPVGSRTETRPDGYLLKVLALRTATDRDRDRARWFALLERAVESERRESLAGLEQAVPLYRESASGWRSTGDDVTLELLALEALAHMTGYFTQHNRESLSARERLAELYPATTERQLEIHNLRSLGTEYLEAGRLEDAKQVVTRALNVAVAGGFSQSAAASERNLGVYEWELGNYERAREHAVQAQQLAAAIPDRPLEALTLWDLARLDSLAGDVDAAIARNTHALKLAAGNAAATNVIMMWLGFNHLSRGELDEAETLFQTRLEAARRTVQRDQEALTRLGLADVKRARGDREGARTGYEAAALALERGAQHWRCVAEQRLGRMDFEDGQLDQAAARFTTMRDIAVARRLPECEAEARAGLADVAVKRGDLDTADAEARRVVELAEGFGLAAISAESRALGFGRLAPAYERAIDVSMRRADRGETSARDRALMLNEQALARGLLDRVAESRLDSRARVPPGLAEEIQHVRDRWRARLAELQVAMRVRPDAPGNAVLVDETRALEVQVRDLEAKVDAADPRHATFVRPRPLGIAAIQALLDHDTVLLEYALGESRSYLWVVSPRDVHAFTLAPRHQIETLARRVHEEFARSPEARGRPASAVSKGVEGQRRLRQLLIEPAAGLLAGKRLVLVLPGALSMVPIGALAGKDGGPLIAQHEIVQVPSATTLAAMRSLTAERSRASKTAAVFADPIFDPQDPRVHRVESSVSPPPPRSTPRFAGLPLTRLPFSRSEAQEIAALSPQSVTVFLGFDATRERAVGRALSDYRFVHFATHGVVNQTLPSLSSVVLSLVDRAGRPRDGFVMLPDVYDMTLNAEVVVLSGCQTALGKDVRGEGPIGLARGFMYAGVPRVVASLWQVDDLATAELMRRFYRGMLVEKRTPAAALRAAQQQLATTRRWRSPYYWAPFILQGDWR